MFQRGGTIIPLKERVRRTSALMASDPITLYVATNYFVRLISFVNADLKWAFFQTDHANGTLYIDDGATFAYTNGEYLYRGFEFKKESDVLYTLTSRYEAIVSRRPV